MAAPILITGASGFLGKHLVEQLRARGEGPLRLLNYGPCPWETAEDLEILDGNITKRDDVERAMQGCQQVYHLAGTVSRDPRDKKKLYDIHVGGTQNICEAAMKFQPERMVLVSSSGTIAASRDPRVWTEADGYRVDVPAHWHYYLSKIEAEKMAFDYARRSSLPIVVVNPALLLGPGDDLGSSTGDVVLFLQGSVMAVPLGGMSFVDARDAAAGLIAAMERGQPGERYLMGVANWSFRRFLEVLSEMTGVRPPLLQLPLSASLWSARLLRRLLPLVGGSFPMDDATIEMSSWFWYCDSSKAVRELGFRPREPMQTLRDTVDYIRTHAA